MTKWKKLLAVVLAGTMLMALAVAGYATEAAPDPEKDLAIGSEYGGGGSPGSEVLDDAPSEDDYTLSPKPMTESQTNAVSAYLESRFTGDGAKMDGALSESFMIYHGRDEQYYEDGSFGSVVSFKNLSSQDLDVQITATAEDEHGVMLDLDMVEYGDGYAVKSNYEKAVHFITPSTYSKIRCKIVLTDAVAKEFEKSFVIERGRMGYANIIIKELYPAGDSSWDAIPTDSTAKPCMNCEPGMTEFDDGEQGNPWNLWIYIIGAIVGVVCLALIVLVYRNRIRKQRKEG